MNLTRIFFVAVCLLVSSAAFARTSDGLLVFYDFREDGGPVVRDRSGVGKPVDLRITKMKAVRRSDGALEVRGETQIRSNQPPVKIFEAVRRTGEITIEAWVRPANTRQDGPARIVTFSKSSVDRNFTLGQDGARFDVRFRTTKTNNNGIPSLSTRNGSLTSNLTHVVYTRERGGRARIYLNGKEAAERTVDGDTSSWNGSFQLSLANELSNGRRWLGTYHLVAIYGRELEPDEVKQNYQAGAKSEATPLAKGPSANERLFHGQIAPLFVRHCFECHDANTRQGELDLSRKKAAFAGGESGKAIVGGKSAESLLWHFVESDDMPKDRAALSSSEKDALRKWIDGGAVWPVETIDPHVYSGSQEVQNWVRRLTVQEYVETVRSAVGVDIEKEAREILPADVRADGFSNTAYNLNVDLKHVEAYAQLAEIIVERMDVGAFARKYTRRKLLTDDHMRDLIAKMGKWILRGPLNEDEIVNYRGISTTVASAGGSFEEAVGYIVRAMLQSPRFIYRIERQRGNGGAWPVGGYELASRLSYLIWGAPPDEALLKAAEEGNLSSREDVERQVRRMLEDPRAVDRSIQFLSQWLNLNRLDNLRPNRHRFPNWSEELAGDMREETLAFFKEVVWEQNRPLADLLNAQVTFVTPQLARHYNMPAPDKGASRVDVSKIPSRGGLLTQGSVLTVGGDEASMVARGLFVLHDLLRGEVKDPPPCVDTTPVPTKEGLTQRSIAESRIANVNCGGCHAKFEPLAFGLEKFDGLGAFHERDEHGNKLRDDGEVLFPGQPKAISYDSSDELMDLLAGSGRVQECITWKVTQFAMGRPLGALDVPVLQKIHETAKEGRGTYASLITAIATSDLVMRIRTEN